MEVFMSMSYYVDVKYASMISSRVRNFKRQNDKTWNFSCPYCGDSVRTKSKARGYIYPKKGTLLYRCHNCNMGTTFAKLLEFLDPNVYSEYVMEKYKSNCTHNHTPKLTPILLPTKPIKTSALDDLQRMSDLAEDHPALSYITNRLIPKKYLELLYFCPKYKQWANKHYKESDKKIENDIPRLIIPHYNQKKELIGWAGRAFGKETLRYHNVKLGDEQLLYGLDRVDINRTIYVTEGQLDSLFIDNCISASGVSAFDSEFMQKHKDKIVLIIDNEPRNIHIVKSIEKYINLCYSVCLLPNTVLEKDINEMILAGYTQENIQTLITNNTVSGLGAKMKFTQWRKI